MKLAFCFLIYDSINHEDIWHSFFKNVDSDKYSIYIHYKINVPLKYFEEYKLKKCVLTQWGDISLVEAQNLLFEEGLKDVDNTHFILVSDSCIPLKPFNYIYDILDVNYSYFTMCPDKDCFPRCDNALKFLDKKYIKKSSQWSILNRKHTELLMESKEYLDWFDYRFSFGDEHCYITYMHYKNLQDEIIDQSTYGPTTFVNWGSLNYVYNKRALYRPPKYYTLIHKEELDHLLSGNYLFGRKFRKDCKVIVRKVYNGTGTTKLVNLKDILIESILQYPYIDLIGYNKIEKCVACNT